MHIKQELQETLLLSYVEKEIKKRLRELA